MTTTQVTDPDRHVKRSRTDKKDKTTVTKTVITHTVWKKNGHDTQGSSSKQRTRSRNQRRWRVTLKTSWSLKRTIRKPCCLVLLLMNHMTSHGSNCVPLKFAGADVVKKTKKMMWSCHTEKTIGFLLAHCWWMTQWLMTTGLWTYHSEYKQSPLTQSVIHWISSDCRCPEPGGQNKDTWIGLIPSFSYQSSWALRVTSMMTLSVWFSCIRTVRLVFWREFPAVLFLAICTLRILRVL